MFPVPTVKIPWYAYPFFWAVMGIDYIFSKVCPREEGEPDDDRR
jgi:hypothetical protein